MTKKAQNSTKKINVPLLTIAALALSAGGFGAYYYNQYTTLKNDPVSANSSDTQAESNDVIAKIKKLILVNDTDAPTVARVDEPDKLRETNAEFYRDVAVGDYLVVYKKRAIVYRASNDQIINIAPILETSTVEQPAIEKPIEP